MLFVLVLLFVTGLQLPEEKIDNQLQVLGVNTENVEDYVDHKESTFNIRPDNEARIIWADSINRVKTEYAILYLHGFSASWYEGYPVHVNAAKYLHANLYLSRLAAHGVFSDKPMIDMTPKKLYDSAKEALLIARTLGNKVIIMGTSTGGTLALQLAYDFPDLVEALVLLSPNVAINDVGAKMLSGPWGLQIARAVGGTGEMRHLDPGSKIEQKYWYKSYRWEAAVYLQQLLDETMKVKHFKAIKHPTFLGYYYKNEEEQDQTVKVTAALEMFENLGTDTLHKKKVVFPEAGDHVIGCEETSGAYLQVQDEVIEFLATTVIK